MGFTSTFPVHPDRVRQEAEQAAEQAVAKKFWSFLDTIGKKVRPQEIKADDLIYRAQELGDVIWHRSRGNIGHTDLDLDLARRSLAKVEDAIQAARDAKKNASNKKKATNFLRKATRSFGIANRMLSGKSTTRGGTLRRKHRKSVKRCKS
jgi:hypothetical protein